MVLFLIILLFFIIPIIGVVKIYSKAERSIVWAFIPVLNFWFLFPIAGLSPWLIFLLIIPVVNFFVVVYLHIKLSEKFSKGIIYALGLTFFPFITYPLLGFNGEYRK